MRIIILHLILCITSSFVNAQSITLGPVEANDTSSLTTSDDKLQEGNYYKYFSINLKAGDGLLVYMESSSFIPFVTLINEDTTGFVQGWIEQIKSDVFGSYINFTTLADTTVFILLTSKESYQTGTFRYVVKQFSGDQLFYDKQMPDCRKLVYLLNQWNADWKMFPITTVLNEETYEEVSTFENTFFNGINGRMIRGKYTEVYSELASEALAISQFDSLTTTFSECLLNSNFKHSSSTDGPVKTEWFTINGFSNGTHAASFSLQLDLSNESAPKMILTLY